ncbi:type II secretion system F family protein [Lactobacillus sp. ESL0791]|uniref:type II secretion system F family protein n=1 Tax=Lactobacillus sp. ESL0791 TaxID=2983234 RepID=UPI0023F7DE59|nr:type II secretion system F family protein [Lactobacillus sp. ESL0791]MDF7638687.1 type II secretion system F family protein [Lactobacillus sp. ESL0791]
MESTKILKKDKLTDAEKLTFLDCLKNSLENGFSLNTSLEIMPVLWPRRKTLMEKVAFAMKAGGHFNEQMLKLGFSRTVVTQVNLAMQQGSLIECLRQLVMLNQLKNEQLKKLKAELSYPFVLAVMMVSLLLFMQTFVSRQFAGSGEYSGDLLIAGLILLALSFVYYLARILNLLAKQDYRSLKKLSHYPIVGSTIKIYVEYLLIYDIGLLLASGFSLQKMCEYASMQEEGSLQQYMGKRVGQKLAAGQSLEQIIKKELFLPNSLLILLQTGSKRDDLGKRCLVFGKSLFTDLIGRIEKLVVNVQPFCFILIGICIIGMYLKLLLPMYSMMQKI